MVHLLSCQFQCGLKFVLILLLASMPSWSFAQETKKVKVNEKDQGFTEEYDVLKSDREHKHGHYIKYGLDKSPLVVGFFNNNLKDSLWTEYFRESKLVKSKGHYKNGEKNGVWSTYFFNGSRVAPASTGVYFDDERVGEWKFYSTDNSLAQKYNYSMGELLYFSKTCTPFDDYLCEVKTKNGTEEVFLDQPPMYLGGHSKMMDDLFAIGVRYPHSAMKKGIEGSVVISFFIDENRKTFGYQIEKGIGGGCDEEALNALTQLSKNWIPGALNGEKVVAKYLVTVDFVRE